VSTSGDKAYLIPAVAQAAHDSASAKGLATYVDPTTGLEVMTSYTLSARGSCCGNGCRHCPWPPSVQAAAGRRVIRD